MENRELLGKVYEEMLALSKEVAWLRSKVEDVHLLTSDLPAIGERSRQQGRSITWLWVFVFAGIGATLPAVVEAFVALYTKL